MTSSGTLDEGTSVAALLARAKATGIDRLDALAILEQVLARSRVWFIAHGETIVAAGDARTCLSMFDRRSTGEPLAYLLGSKEFHGLALHVDPSVLIPRPDTETLVDWALEILQTSLRPLSSPRVIDLGTGSGAIALAIKSSCSRAEVSALDASNAAIDVARRNAAAHGLRVNFLVSDWWQAVPQQTFDLVVSNPPYIAEHDPHLPALRHEPRSALISGAQGLDALSAIVEATESRLAPAGWLLLEHGYDQGELVRKLLEDRGYSKIETRRDLAGNERCSGGRVRVS